MTESETWAVWGGWPALCDRHRSASAWTRKGTRFRPRGTDENFSSIRLDQFVDPLRSFLVPPSVLSRGLRDGTRRMTKRFPSATIQCRSALSGAGRTVSIDGYCRCAESRASRL